MVSGSGPRGGGGEKPSGEQLLSWVTAIATIAATVVALIAFLDAGVRTAQRLTVTVVVGVLVAAGWRSYLLHQRGRLDRPLVTMLVSVVVGLGAMVVVSQNRVDGLEAQQPEEETSTSTTSTASTTTSAAAPDPGATPPIVAAGRVRLAPEDYRGLDFDRWEGMAEEDGRSDLELADGYLSVVNDARVAWSDGDAFEDCESVTDWGSSVKVGLENHVSEEDPTLLDDGTLCVLTSEGHLAGMTATSVAHFGDKATLAGTTWDLP